MPVHEYILFVDGGRLIISFTFGDNPCIHIQNSHLVKSKKAIKTILANYIHKTSSYKELKAAGYTRSLKSEYREWRAHNILYRLGYKRHRTGTTDIDQKESKFRRFIYAILSIF